MKPVQVARGWSRPCRPGHRPRTASCIARHPLPGQLNTHVSAFIRTLLSGHWDWLTMVQLPAYTPGLNPLADAWANMKDSLGNLGPIDGFLAPTRLNLQANPSPTGPFSLRSGLRTLSLTNTSIVIIQEERVLRRAQVP